MDVLDAGVFVSKWEAEVPKEARLVLWGPLQAKEMGLDGWEVQDGGETGFVVHNPGIKLTMGRATSTLIFVRRLRRAYLTVYFGGYPADAPEQQRHLDMQKVISAREMFLGRLAKAPVTFTLQADMTLVDNVNDAVLDAVAQRAPALPRDAQATTSGRRAPARTGVYVDGEPVPRRVDGGGAEVWEV